MHRHRVLDHPPLFLLLHLEVPRQPDHLLLCLQAQVLPPSENKRGAKAVTTSPVAAPRNAIVPRAVEPRENIKLAEGNPLIGC